MIRRTIASNSRVHKERLIDKDDVLIGSVPLINGVPDRCALQEVEGKVSTLRLTRNAVIKTWTGADTIEVYISRRVSC